MVELVMLEGLTMAVAEAEEHLPQVQMEVQQLEVMAEQELIVQFQEHR
jgi:hypothetical protein